MSEQQSILQEILHVKAKEVEEASHLVALEDLQAKAKLLPPCVGFARSLAAKSPFGVIAEIKRSSPSRGPIRPDLDPVETAKAFRDAGAACLSVLTDEQFFGGSLEFLKRVKSAAPEMPVLRKDFTISAYQVWETRAAGADALLLIAAALPETQLLGLLSESFQAGLDVLIEVHSEEELISAYETVSQVSVAKRPTTAPQVLLGINNRDLRTFVTDIEISKTLLLTLEKLRVARGDDSPLLTVSESGIRTGADMKALADAGARSFLIGESLLAKGEPGENLRNLLLEAVRP